MLDKRVPSLAAAVDGVRDGATVLIGGFGNSGVPVELTHALLEQGDADMYANKRRLAERGDQ